MSAGREDSGNPFSKAALEILLGKRVEILELKMALSEFQSAAKSLKQGRSERIHI
jgi:hypothetical protein